MVETLDILPDPLHLLAFREKPTDNDISRKNPTLPDITPLLKKGNAAWTLRNLPYGKNNGLPIFRGFFPASKPRYSLLLTRKISTKYSVCPIKEKRNERKLRIIYTKTAIFSSHNRRNSVFLKNSPAFSLLFLPYLHYPCNFEQRKHTNHDFPQKPSKNHGSNYTKQKVPDKETPSARGTAHKSLLDVHDRETKLHATRQPSAAFTREQRT